MSANCIFCKIIKGDIPSIKIAETAMSYAFMDISPLSRGHCLVIPKEHAERFHQLSEDSAADVGRLLNRVSKAMGVDDFNILQNNGAICNQAVFHVHFHIIPKTSEDDGLGIRWKPNETISKEKITEIGAAITEGIKRNAAAAEGKAEEKQ